MSIIKKEIYKKVTPQEHVLLRPSCYIGNILNTESKEYIFNNETNKMELKNVFYNPGFLKIVDEIFSNAIDHYHRPNTNVSKISILIDKQNISITNNGKCIPIEKQEETDIYIPTFIFGNLLTSSNYDDNEDRKWVGTNGLGSKLTNIFSLKFRVETFCSSKNLYFSQTWKNNMSVVEDPIIKTLNKKNDFTTITFTPDLKRFSMNSIEGDIIDVIEKKVQETAGVNPGLELTFNKKKISYSSFSQFVSLFFDNSLKVIKEKQNNWEYLVVVIPNSGKSISFVNSVLTSEGGTHVKFILDQIIKLIKPILIKKTKRDITSSQIKNNLFLFLNCTIINPKYDSQTKTKLINKINEDLIISNKFINELLSSSLISIINSQNDNKEIKTLNKVSGKKVNKITGITKLEDANNAGTKDSLNCVLILTEGDSAKSLAVSGFSIIGRDRYGVFPLKGKPLNVNGQKLDKIRNNEEINNIVKIIGLKYGKTYKTEEDFKTLRYGKIMLMTDQDHDGSHIKGLIINLFHSMWPSLLYNNFIQQLITPIIKATFKNKTIVFYNTKDYNNWIENNIESKHYSIKYYKGLGTSTSKEAKDYFSNVKNRYDFVYKKDDDKEIEKAFNKDKIEERKNWLIDSMKKNINTEIIPLYNNSEETKNKVSYSDYINNELIYFSITDNLRSLANIIDGLKISQRKILFTCFSKISKDKKELKVEQLSGLVSAESAYHYGEASLNSTIIHLAQNFVGSNNINLLNPSGQFGTRLNGGSDHASPRYIFTNLSYITRFIYRPEDDPILIYKVEENQSIEPEFYIPIIPIILINGSKGIGTGWSSNIPCFNPLEIINELKKMIINNRETDIELIPWFYNFKNIIKKQKSNTFLSTGTVYINEEDCSVIISELPINLWTIVFREKITNLIESGGILDFKEYSTDYHVCFIIYFNREVFNDCLHVKENGFYNYLKITSIIKTSNLVGFDENNVLQVYKNISEIINNYYKVRLDYYQKRKDYIIKKKKIDIIIYKNKAKFIDMRVKKNLDIENIEEEEIIKNLIKLSFDSDPRSSNKENDYDYLLSMTLKSFSKQKIDEFLKKKKEEEFLLQELEKTSISSIWLKELDELLNAYSKHKEIYKVDQFDINKIIKLNKYVQLNYDIKKDLKNFVDSFEELNCF